MNIKSTLLLHICVLFFIVACNSVQEKQNTKIDLGSSKMPMPSERLQKLNVRYKIAFLPDGFPGKRLQNGNIYTHPLYGTYILKDYIAQYKKDSSALMYSSIIKLADLCISKMDSKEGALIFYYEPCEEFGYGERFYSSLAQSSYLIPLYKTHLLTGDTKYEKATRQVLKSLFLPIKKGGVALKTNHFYSIEEDPTLPHGIILNGWLSALNSVKEYYDLSGDSLAYNLLSKSLKTVPRMLHLYDNEKYANSRYHLKGYQKFKLEFKDNAVCLLGGYVDNKLLGKHSFSFLSKLERESYTNYIEKESFSYSKSRVCLKDYSFIMNTILNRISYPVKNEIVLKLNSQTDNNPVTVKRMKYDFSPKKGILELDKWEKDTIINLKKGFNRISFSPNWKDLNLIGYPTTFKEFNNGHFNVYHYIHIDRLKKLNQVLENDTIQFYIEKWQNYTAKWPKMKLYDGVKYGPYR